ATSGNTQAAIRWTAPASTGGSAITGYTARAWSATTAGTQLGSCTAATTTCTITGLANGTAVYIDVIATNATGSGAASTPRVAVTPRTVPGAPTTVVTTPGNGRLTVAWAAPSNTGGSAITGYTATAWSSATGGVALKSCQSDAANRSCRIAGLTNGVTVYVDVVAINAAGTGTASAPRVASAPSAAAGQARRVNQRDADQGRQIIVSWTAPEDDGGLPITGYIVSAWDAPVGGSVLAKCSTTGATTCTLTGLEKNRRYYIDVAVQTSAGTSTFAAPRTATR
ncbi:MAG: fibronectin type III domain-containing protein, partial [Actinomycetales bacterium]